MSTSEGLALDLLAAVALPSASARARAARAGGRGAAATKRRADRGGRPHPTTSDTIEYSGDELEFGRALDLYKNRTGRRFPTNAEVLGVLKGLGYAKPSASPSEA